MLNNGIFRDVKRGTWYINTRVNLGGGVSKKIMRRGFASKREASSVFSTLVDDIKNKLIRKMNYRNFSDLVLAWQEYRSTKVRRSTSRNQTGIINGYILKSFKNKDVRDVFQADNLRRWREKITKLEWKIDWRNKIIRTMVELLDFAYKRGYVDAELFRLGNIELEPMSTDGGEVPQEKKIWVPAEYKSFLASFDSRDRFLELFEVFFFLGCRIGELCGLQWRDYNHVNKQIHIHQQANPRLGTGKSEITQTKTARGDRYEDLDNHIDGILFKMYEEMKPEPLDYIFFGGKEPIGQTTIRAHLEKQIKKSGITRITPHGLRHTNDSWLLSTAKTIEDVEVIARRNGHSTKQALDTYAHIVNKSQKDLIDILGR